MPLEVGVLVGPYPAFARMTYPRLGPLLSVPKPGVLAVGAEHDGAPVGLALGRCGTNTGFLLSVMVDRAWRRQGIGRQILSTLQRAMAAARIGRLRTEYPGSLVSRVALESLLSCLTWGAPQLHSVQLIGYAGAMAEAGGHWPGVRHLLANNGRIIVSPWTPTNPSDQEALEGLLAEDLAIVPPDPRRWVAVLEPGTSFALRRDGVLIGWIIGERVSGGYGAHSASQGVPSVHYPSAYCARLHRKGGGLIAGYHHAFSAQAALLGPHSRAIYRTHPGATAMLALTRRRFAPIALRVDEIMAADINLEQD